MGSLLGPIGIDWTYSIYLRPLGSATGGRPTTALRAILFDNDRKKSSATRETCEARADFKIVARAVKGGADQRKPYDGLRNSFVRRTLLSKNYKGIADF
jgi:hypothetical protein